MDSLDSLHPVLLRCDRCGWVVPVAPGITLIAAGQPRCVMTVNGDKGGLTLRPPGRSEPEVLYPGRV